MAATRQGSKLIVRNLPFTVGNAELRDFFSKFGQVHFARVMFDFKTGLSQKYGFVRLATESQTESALRKPVHFLEGNYIEISKAIVRNTQRNLSRET